MKIQAKEILVILIGIVGTLILTISFENRLINLGSITLQDILILIIISIIAIIYVIYKRMDEIEDDIENIKKDYNKLDERLKIHKQLINLDARLIALEKEKNGKKK